MTGEHLPHPLPGDAEEFTHLDHRLTGEVGAADSSVKFRVRSTSRATPNVSLDNLFHSGYRNT